jgi:hypothetical protein
MAELYVRLSIITLVEVGLKFCANRNKSSEWNIWVCAVGATREM